MESEELGRSRTSGFSPDPQEAWDACDIGSEDWPFHHSVVGRVGPGEALEG